jgi:hypothetical protein
MEEYSTRLRALMPNPNPDPYPEPDEDGGEKAPGRRFA